MEFELSSDQKLLLNSVETLLERFKIPPTGVHGYVEYSVELQAQLNESGFLEVASHDDYGLLEAALLVEEIAKLAAQSVSTQQRLR